MTTWPSPPTKTSRAGCAGGSTCPASNRSACKAPHTAASTSTGPAMPTCGGATVSRLPTSCRMCRRAIKCGRMHGHGFEVILHANAGPGRARPVHRLRPSRRGLGAAAFRTELPLPERDRGPAEPHQREHLGLAVGQAEARAARAELGDGLRDRLQRRELQRPELPHLEGDDAGQRRSHATGACWPSAGRHPRPHLHLAPAPGRAAGPRSWAGRWTSAM
jgi:hypothetical protein